MSGKEAKGAFALTLAAADIGGHPTDPPHSPADIRHVPETDFGKWFLGTETWVIHVLQRALPDLDRLIADRRPSYPVVLDAGCGWGRAVPLLKDRFAAERIIGVDIDPAMLVAAKTEADRHGIQAEFHRAPTTQLPVADGSVDLVFCHQTFHHLVDQQSTLREFHRVLRKGGLLLFAESTRAYIHSWMIKLFFRHPMDVQRTAQDYIGLIRHAGFHVDPGAVSYPYLWWSRPDLGAKQYLLGIKPAAGHEETLVNLVAIRP